jgi:hypothetical protein
MAVDLRSEEMRHIGLVLCSLDSRYVRIPIHFTNLKYQLSDQKICYKKEKLGEGADQQTITGWTYPDMYLRIMQSFDE